ncbi:MAG: WYL domain-containing protein [Pseudonocardiaceae bacterium]|nr:WYL domain-containing protein [Pseudonocardiaceae bacterium]
MAVKARPQTSPLTKLLRGMDAGTLTALVAARPDTVAAPEPRSLDELAQRLSADGSVRRAVQQLPVPAIQLLEVLQALGDGCRRGELDRFCDVDPGTLDGLLATLSRLALAWPERDTIRITAALAHFTADPLALGDPADTLLAPLTVEQLRSIGAEYAVPAQPRKAEWVRALVDILSDPARVRAALADAAPEAAEPAELLAWHGPRARGPVEAALSRYGFGRAPDPVTTWLATHGFVLPSGWNQGQMPREVALAIRGEDYHPPLLVEAPVLATAARSGQPAPTAATSIVDGVRRLLVTIGARPAQQLAAGGVGVRELRRLAKELHATEGDVRLWLELAVSGGLARLHDSTVLPTPDADHWLTSTPGAALALLHRAWHCIGPVPSHRVDGDGKTLPALDGSGAGPMGPPLRRDLLAALAELPAGTAVTDLDTLIDLLAWRHPLRYVDADVLGPHLVGTWTEAQRLGLLDDGALTALGRAAAAGSHDELAAVAEQLLPAPVEHATFLPDLTAIVSGPPSTALTELLDAVADRESHDTASTWRLSPTSVRRALDAGHGPDELVARLSEVADRALPQPVHYLITDAARRHGQLQVHPVACCVCTGDEALAAEIAHHRALAKLGIRRLAPTVLASAEPVERTLTLLREAGYSPVRQSDTGQTVLERVEPRRAPALTGPRRRSSPPTDPAAVASRLADGAEVELDPLELGSDTEFVLEAAEALDGAQARLLAHAIEHQVPVCIEYVSGSGGRSERVIEPIQLVFDALQAWCRLRDDERIFRLDRIRSVSPA